MSASREERVEALRKRVAADPYDAAAWEALVSEADRARRGPERDAELAGVYEDLLAKFPTAAGYWREYADHVMATGDEAAVKAVFSRCLLTCLSVDLWRAYLNFIKRLNEPRGAAGLPEIRQAFEFTLDRLGQDSGCGAIWQDYIAFLQAPRQGSPEYAALYGEAMEGQEESAKVAAVRRGYQRALLVPSPQLEALWRGYEGLEMSGSNKQLARRLLDEWRPKYQAARSLLRERESRLGGINTKALALPAGRGGFTQQSQAAAWREYLAWERSNPQRLDMPTYVARVSLAFEQALMVLFHYPDIWLEFAAWHQANGSGGAAAAAVLDKGRAALPSALTLHFAAADLQETLGAPAAAKVIYEELVESLKPAGEQKAAAPAAAAASAAATPAAVKQEGSSAAQEAGEQQAAEGAADGQQQAGGEAAAADGAAAVKVEAAEQAPPPPAAAAAAAEGQQEAAPPQQAQEQAQQAQQGGMQLSAEQGTLAWIQYMRYARRAEGIMAARKLFMRARKWPDMRWQAYAASALMEWRHEAKDTIPRNIFELGLKSHLGEPGLVLAYAQFLIGLGDVANTRALFERALNATAPEAAAELWDAYLAFEYDVGTLQAAAAVEQRRADAAAALHEAQAAAAAGAALDGKAAPAQEKPGARHEALRLALLKYKVQGLWPGSAVQQLCFERLLGQAPALESGAREHDSRRDRDRERRRSRSRSRSPAGRERGHRERSPSPPRRGHAPRSPLRENEPIRLSRELAQLMSQLPPPHMVEGPVPDVERVVQVILAADLTPDGIIAHEVAAARERRRQRRMGEMGGAPGGDPGGAPGGAPGAYPGGAAGQKRKTLADYDSGSESDDDEGYNMPVGGAAAPGAPAGDVGGMAGQAGMPGGGLDIYRMRRKQQRA